MPTIKITTQNCSHFKYLLPILFLFFSMFCYASKINEQNAQKDPILNTLQTELNREFKKLKKAKPPVYFLSYQITKQKKIFLTASLGEINYNEDTENAHLDISARVGSPKLDDTRKLKTNDYNMIGWVENIVTLTDLSALKNQLWLSTEDAVKTAQEKYLKVLTNMKTASERSDNSDDFSAPPAKPALYAEDTPQLTINLEEIKDELKNLSLLLKGYPFILSSSVIFSAKQETNYYVNSEGTKIKTSRTLFRLGYILTSRNEDGMQLSRGKNYDGFTFDELAKEEQIKEDILKSIEELRQLQNASPADTFHGPVILRNKAAGVFFHEILGHRVEGHRQKDDDFGQTFTQKLNQQIVSPLISVYDDPTLQFYKGQALRGYYLYDDEGTPSQKTLIIKDGILRGFLMGRSPIKNFPTSNGHARKSYGFKPVSRMGVTIVEPSSTVSYDELKQMLKEEIKKQNKPYGLIIDDISGGFTNITTYSPQSFKVQPLLVYKVYPDDRPDEIIRGADIVGTPLTSFNKIIAAADDYDVFNGSCGAESGWVPVSAISPSLLISELEIEKVSKSYNKLPILPPPSVNETGNKTKKQESK